MRLPDIFSRHPRDDISAHADGELAPDRLDALETHLAGCERCRKELADLLAVRSALRDLPQFAAPRSFTLTPAMAEGETSPVTSPTTPSFVAMRVAGAGFAAVLAVVVLLDAGGIADDNGSGDDSSTELFDAAPASRIVTNSGIQEDDVAPLSDVTDGGADDLGTIEIPPTGDDGSGPDSGGTAGSVGGGPDSGGTAAGGGVGGTSSSGGTTGGVTSGGEATADAGRAVPQPVEGVPESVDEAATAITSEDDGLSSLLVIEIGLAAIAALAIGGSFLMRRRAEQE